MQILTVNTAVLSQILSLLSTFIDRLCCTVQFYEEMFQKHQPSPILWTFPYKFNCILVKAPVLVKTFTL
ncbi:hypothetical protein Q8A67_000527 [Cirrhinus molitorella]|uniref:Uncharacterized protein n=1 Tax=Cirrhinus molitorella TaxID=172907 RepID=A0AA88Q5H9_9TELE|nr:hypothetical protein Q8A67_000527 [Cirrhinus molitorella]